MTFTFKLSKRLAASRATLLAAAGALALVAGCEQGQVAAPGSTAAIVDSITVTPTLVTSTVSDTLRFKAVLFNPSGNPLANGTVSWSTSDTSVASVDATGLVMSRAPGAAMITATTQGRHGGGQVHVSPKPVATVTVLPALSTLTVARALQYSAVLQSAKGDTLTGRAVSWKTSDTLIATVNATGLLTAKAVGGVTITATSETKIGTTTLTVSTVPVASVAVSPLTASLTVRQTQQFSAVAVGAANDTLAGRAFAWKTSDTSLATVSVSGVVTAKVAGSVTVTATSETKIGTATVTMTAAPVASVTVSPLTASLTVPQTRQFSAVAVSAANDTLTGRAVVWKTSDTSLATVSATGLLTTKAAGSVTVTATSETKIGTATVTVSAAAGTTHAGWYTSPAGTAGAAGSSTNPWDLQTALSGGNGKVQPGDTIWLRGGTYAGTFTSSLTGTLAAPIVVRQYPGERATLDAASSSIDVLTVNGQYATFWGFEIMNSGTLRTGTAGTGAGLRGDGVYVNGGSNIKLINLVVHDVGHGVFTENTAHNIEIYGWVIYNGGYQDGTRSDGHGIYLHNDGATWKVARDNVIFNNFGYGIHAYAEVTSQLENLVLDGNVIFNNGTISSYDNNQNLQLGGNGVADQDSVTNNVLVFTDSMWMNVRIGYSSLVNGTALFANNTVVGGREAFDVGCWNNLTVQNNTFMTAAGYESYLVVQRCGGTQAGWSGNQMLTTRPTTSQVVVRRNRYEAGRGMIVVNNWTGQGSVSADLSGVVTVGAHYEIRNVQDIYGSPVASGTYGGGAVTVPMGGVTPPQVIGGSPNAPIKTGPYFDTFIVTSY